MDKRTAAMDHENRQPRTGPDGQSGGRSEASPAPESAAPAKREDRPTSGAPGAAQNAEENKNEDKTQNN